MEITLAKKELFVIGQILSIATQTQNSIKFLLEIDKKCINSANLETDVTVEITVEDLFYIIEILGKREEFYFTEFNKTVKTKLLTTVMGMPDSELKADILARFGQMNNMIEFYLNNLASQYIYTHGLND